MPLVARQRTYPYLWHYQETQRQDTESLEKRPAGGMAGRQAGGGSCTLNPFNRPFSLALNAGNSFHSIKQLVLLDRILHNMVICLLPLAIAAM